MKFFKIPKIAPDSDKDYKSGTEEFPILPLRDLVIFPQTIISVFITYKAGISAVEEAITRKLRTFAVCQKNAETGETWDTGTVVKIIQHLRLPDHTFRVVFQGEYRACMMPGRNQLNAPLVWVKPLQALQENSRELSSPGTINPEISALMRAVQKSFAQYAELSKKINTEIISAVEKTGNCR